jgi:hypothetical protein
MIWWHAVAGGENGEWGGWKTGIEGRKMKNHLCGLSLRQSLYLSFAPPHSFIHLLIYLIFARFFYSFFYLDFTLILQ